MARLLEFYHVDAWQWTLPRCVIMWNAMCEIAKERRGKSDVGEFFEKNVIPGTVRTYYLARTK